MNCRNIRRVLALLMMVAMCFTLCACGAEPEVVMTPAPTSTPEPTPVPTPVPTPEPTPEPIVGEILTDDDGGFLRFVAGVVYVREGVAIAEGVSANGGHANRNVY